MNSQLFNIPGYGYRFLAKGERTINTDEHLFDGRWIKTENPGLSAPRNFYRRKIDPGEGYEIVPGGATIECGMEIQDEAGNWKVVNEKTLGLNAYYPWCYRRKKHTATWISVKDKLPDLQQRVVAYRVGELPCCTQFEFGKFKCNPQPDYWLPLPPLPRPTTSELDPQLAWGRYISGQPGADSISFFAGWHAAKGQL